MEKFLDFNELALTSQLEDTGYIPPLIKKINLKKGRLVGIQFHGSITKIMVRVNIVNDNNPISNIFCPIDVALAYL